MPTEKSRFPLSWPLGWPRIDPAKRKDAPFTSHRRDITISGAVSRLELELIRLGATDPMMSSNLKLSLSGVPYSGQAEPADRGVAVYFRLKGHERVLACDKYTSCAGNIAAIAAHIDALRRIDRYGVGSVEQAFAGYTALPGPGVDNRPPWRKILGFAAHTRVSVEAVNVNYRALAKATNGNEAALLELNLARDAAMQELSPDA